MSVSRRRILQSVALAGAEPSLPLEALRNVAAVHGTKLSEERLRVLQPALERRRAQLQALRDLELDDSVAPVAGILE